MTDPETEQIPDLSKSASDNHSESPSKSEIRLSTSSGNKDKISRSDSMDYES